MLFDVELPANSAKVFSQLPVLEQERLASSFFLSDLATIPSVKLPSNQPRRVGVPIPLTTAELLQIGHPVQQIRLKLANYICERIGVARGREAELSEEWAKLQVERWGNYITEVRVSTGRIDLVFPQERLIIEAKFVKGWKGALGQVLAYQEVYRPGFRAGLLLLGSSPDQTLIEKICGKFQVAVYFSEV